MLDFAYMTARCVALVATIGSIFVLFPAIFALNSVLMFPIFGFFVIFYAAAIYWQAEWFIKGDK